MLRADSVTAELREGLFQQLLLEKRCRDLVPFRPLPPAPGMRLPSPFLPLLSHCHESFGESEVSLRPRGGAGAEMPQRRQGHGGGARWEVFRTDGDIGLTESCLNREQSLTRSFPAQ